MASVTRIRAVIVSFSVSLPFTVSATPPPTRPTSTAAVVVVGVMVVTMPSVIS